MNISAQTAFPLAKFRLAASPTLLLAVLGLNVLSSLTLHADVSAQPRHCWGTVELGVGQVGQKQAGLTESNTRFYMGFEGGIAVNDRLLLGGELAGWLIQSGNLHDGSKGAGISQVFAVARIYPQANSPLHLQLGAGLITAWDNATASSHPGSGWEAGRGFDFNVTPHRAITPFVRYFGGKTKHVTLSAVTGGRGCNRRY